MIFNGRGKLRLKNNKWLTRDKEIVKITDFDYLYYPLSYKDNTEFTLCINVGDKVKVGELLAYSSTEEYMPIYASVSGIVESVATLLHVANEKEVNHIKIKNDFQYQKMDCNKIKPLSNINSDEIINVIKDYGVCGNSGIATYTKYSEPGRVETLLVNGTESEPFITIDYYLMKNHIKELIDGTKILMKAANALNAIIAITINKKDIAKEIEIYLKDNNIENITIRIVPNQYPIGWAHALIKKIFDRTYNLSPKEIGIIVNNSSTVIKVARIFNGTYDYMTSFTLSGDAIEQVANISVPIGAKLSDVISKFTKYNEDVTTQNTHLVIGGPMKGKSIKSDEFAITSYHNAFIVLYDKKYNEFPCFNCGRCVEFCPVGLQPVLINRALEKKSIKSLRKLSVNDCTTCGLCTYVCPSRIDIQKKVIEAQLFYNTKQ